MSYHWKGNIGLMLMAKTILDGNWLSRQSITWKIFSMLKILLQVIGHAIETYNRKLITSQLHAMCVGGFRVKHLAQ